MQKVVTKSLEETHVEAERFIRELISDRVANERGGAVLLALQGDLGAGKTAFVQGIAKALGITETITSPTFVLMKQYVLPADGRWQMAEVRTLVHIDAYRLDNGGDIQALGLKDMLVNENHLIVLEWPERVAEALPKDAITISFKFIDETTREICLPKLKMKNQR